VRKVGSYLDKLAISPAPAASNTKAEDEEEAAAAPPPPKPKPPPRVIGRLGDMPGCVDRPCGVACDGESLYVADTYNHRVQKLSLADGAVLGTAGKADCSGGDGEGQLNRPYGMCVAAPGVLYVCDQRNHRIVCLGTADLGWRCAALRLYPSLPLAFPSIVRASLVAQVRVRLSRQR
jgi:hypothetical protein